MIGKYIERRVAAVLEERAGYSDLLLAGLESLASGSAGDVLRTSALETAAQLWAGALAAADVTGTDALTPDTLAILGRQLVRNGEMVFEIRVSGSRVQLYPAAEWEIMEGWRYRCQLQEPPGKAVSRTIPRAKVCHFTWATDPREPWRGIAPMAAAALAAKVAANTETRLGEEAGAPSALILPIPTDGGATTLDSLRTDIGDAKGGAILLESTAAGWDEGRAKGTLADWKAQRLGPEIPENLRQLHEDALQRVLAACGIPGSLASVGADGTQLREDYRRFVMLAVQPMARRIAAEASAKLDADVQLDFHGLHAHDIVARANAYGKLRETMEEDEARRLAGLDVAGVV